MDNYKNNACDMYSVLFFFEEVKMNYITKSKVSLLAQGVPEKNNKV